MLVTNVMKEHETLQAKITSASMVMNNITHENEGSFFKNISQFFASKMQVIGSVFGFNSDRVEKFDSMKKPNEYNKDLFGLKKKMDSIVDTRRYTSIENIDVPTVVGLKVPLNELVDGLQEALGIINGKLYSVLDSIDIEAAKILSSDDYRKSTRPIKLNEDITKINNSLDKILTKMINPRLINDVTKFNKLFPKNIESLRQVYNGTMNLDAMATSKAMLQIQQKTKDVAEKVDHIAEQLNRNKDFEISKPILKAFMSDVKEAANFVTNSMSFVHLYNQLNMILKGIILILDGLSTESWKHTSVDPYGNVTKFNYDKTACISSVSLENYNVSQEGIFDFFKAIGQKLGLVSKEVQEEVNEIEQYIKSNGSSVKEKNPLYAIKKTNVAWYINQSDKSGKNNLFTKSLDQHVKRLQIFSFSDVLSDVIKIGGQLAKDNSNDDVFWPYLKKISSIASSKAPDPISDAFMGVCIDNLNEDFKRKAKSLFVPFELVNCTSSEAYALGMIVNMADPAMALAVGNMLPTYIETYEVPNKDIMNDKLEQVDVTEADIKFLLNLVKNNITGYKKMESEVKSNINEIKRLASEADSHSRWHGYLVDAFGSAYKERCKYYYDLLFDMLRVVKAGVGMK